MGERRDRQVVIKTGALVPGTKRLGKSALKFERAAKLAAAEDDEGAE